MPRAAGSPELDALIDRVLEAAGSPENRRRRSVRPRMCFQLEEPIAFTLLDDMSVERFYSDPLYNAEQTLRWRLWRWETFPDDGMPIETSLPAHLGFYPEYTYAGLWVRYNERGVPDIQADHPLATDPDLRHLAPLDFERSGWMPRALAWHQSITELVKGRLEVPFAATWWRGCLDIAIQLRGYEGFLTDTAERPAFAHNLLSFLTEQRCRWWEAYCARFGKPLEPTFIGDDWINVPFISPALFRDFVLPRYLEIERFHGGIAGIHSCGNQAPVQKHLLEIRSLPSLEVSPWTDLEATLVNVPADKQLVVSIHPNDVLCASPEEMERRLATILRLCEGRRFMVGTSGLTPLSTDIDDFVRRVRTWTRIARNLSARAASLTAPVAGAAKESLS
jgi:hypothetical protein